MSENLVPGGREYGARKKLVEQRRQAGLPLNATSASPPTASGRAPALPSPPPAQAFRPDFDPLRELSPEAFPGLSAPGPAPGPLDQDRSVFEALASSASSALVREVAARLLGRPAGSSVELAPARQITSVDV